MAKLKGPLFSLGASGAIGKTLIFSTWKGLDVAREYVIPANPRTDPQIAHRGRFTAVVDAIHAAETHATTPLGPVDKSAYALYGSCEPTPRTWFNQIVAGWLLAKVNAEHPQIFAHAVFTDPPTGKITITLVNHHYATEPGRFYCGTSKTALTKSVAANGVGSLHTGAFIDLTKGVKYYFQFRPTKVTNDKYVARSGIYYHVCI